MSGFRQFAIVSCAVLALGTAAYAKGNGGGAGSPGGSGGAASVMTASAPAAAATPNDPNGRGRTGRSPRSIPLNCSSDASARGPAMCHWNPR